MESETNRNSSRPATAARPRPAARIAGPEAGLPFTFQRLSGACCVSGRIFAEGDRVASYLVKATTEEVARYDLLAEQAGGFSPEGRVICRWVQVCKPRAKEENRDRALKLTAESLFLTLADPATEPTPENTRLLQFLALMLERKRLLKPRGRTPDGARLVLEHAGSKQLYEVPAGELTPEFFVAVQRQLSVLVGGADDPPAAAG